MPPVIRALGSPSSVTIGMVVYNGEAYLKRAIDSLLQQSYGDFRLIISDNASDDGTEAICQHYAAIDPRIYYVRQANNCGVIANIWKVLEMADSPYFMWASHDDWWHPEFVEKMKGQLDRDAEIGLAFCWVNVVHPDSREVLKTFQPAGGLRDRPLLNFVNELLSPCVNKYYGLYRTDLLRSFPYYKYALMDYHDTLLVDYINLHSRVSVAPEFLFNYSEKPGKKRISLDPKVQALPIVLTGRFYQFNHLAYMAACVKLINDSSLSPSRKAVAILAFLGIFSGGKLGRFSAGKALRRLKPSL